MSSRKERQDPAHDPDLEDVKRGMPRSLLYALIPVGFVLIVLAIMWGGSEAEDRIPEDAVVETEEATSG